VTHAPRLLSLEHYAITDGCSLTQAVQQIVQLWSTDVLAPALMAVSVEHVASAVIG